MYKTKRTPSNAVPASMHSKSSGPLGSNPFVPSSAPGSDQQWKKSASRKAKTRMSNKITKLNNINPRSTEYDDKFIEWEIPNTEQIIVHDRKHALTGFYETDMMVSDWKSEQKRSYNKKEIESTGKMVAGVSNPTHENIADTFIWTNEKSKEHRNQGKVPVPIFTENSSQFKWPSEIQRVQPKYEGKNTSIQLDMDNKGTQEWHSEYNQRCAELRRKQAELIATQSTLKNVAGVANVPHEQIPTFYAWEEDESVPRQIPVPVPSRNPRSESEYKTNFVDWPIIADKQVAIVNKDQLDLFEDNNVLASSFNERATSVLKENYPIYDINTLNKVNKLPVAGVSSKNLQNKQYQSENDQPNSMFAWSSGSINEDIIVSENKNKKVKNLTLNDNCSEYTLKFIAPSPAVDLGDNTRVLKSSAQNNSLNLFEDIKGTNESKSDLSEYNAQYVQHSENLAVNPTKMKSISSLKYPVQFAWELEHTDPNTIALDPKLQLNRPKDSKQDESEYQRKFNWPTTSSSVTAGVATQKKSDSEPIMALDDLDLNASKWQSEYDERCALLRKKQQDLVNSTSKPQHIAGIPSKLKDQIPINYAWETTSQSINKVSHGNEDNRTSEYDEMFGKWNNTNRSMDSLPIAGKSHTKDHKDLNIFSEERIENKNNVTSEDLTYEIISKPLLSEYDESFHAHTSTNSVSNNIIKKPIDLVPAQFAWERIDPVIEKVPKQPIVATDPSMIEKSEYNSQFSWPPKVDVDKVGNQKATIANQNQNNDIIIPIPGKSANDSNHPNQWISEYDDHTADVKKATIEATIPAGIVTIKQDDLPHFYAWLDKEATKQVKPIIPKYTSEQTKSEYDDNYINWPSNRVEKIIPPSSSENYNVITNATSGETCCLLVKTEYEDKYLPHSLETIKTQVNPYANKNIDSSSATSLNDNNSTSTKVIPPQFAWPLVDAIPNKKAVFSKNSIKDTEYNSQYIWRELNDSNVFNKSFIADRIIENPIIIDAKPTTWISEYDERCETVQKKLLDKEIDVIKPIAGIISQGHIEIPPFCAWKPKENQNNPMIPVTNTNKHVNPDLTEYSANFKTWPVKVESQNKSRQTELQYGETFNNFTFLSNDRKFSGVSEYDAQYQGKENDVNISNIAANRDRYIDTNPIYTIDSTEKDIPIPRSNNKNNPAFQTETSDNFKWPQPISELKSPLHWNKSKVVFGTNHPSTTNIISKSNKEIPFKSARLNEDPNSLKSTGNVDFPLDSETKENYSWPYSQQIKKNIRDNSRHYNDRSLVLSNSSKSTINLNKNNQPYLAQKYELSESQNTGIISADSLVDTTTAIHTADTTYLKEPSITSKLTQISNIPGLRSTLDSNSHTMNRPRSAPARRNQVPMTYETYKSKSKVFSYDEDNSSNPVLMNKRYPYVSKKQLGRWTTETSDSFKWKKKNNPALLVTTYMNNL